MVNALLLNHREVSSFDGSSGKVIASISLSRVLLSMPIAQKMDENRFCGVICFVCFFSREMILLQTWPIQRCYQQQQSSED